MQTLRRRDTAPEIALRSLLHRRGLRFRVDAKPEATLRGRADIVFSRARVAVYVDGCFWHGCPQHATWPKANAAWWREKIGANQVRDARSDAALTSLGWKVVRVWEHEASEHAARGIERLVRRRLPSPAGSRPSSLAPVRPRGDSRRGTSASS